MRIQNVPTYFMINLNIVLSNLHIIKDDTVVNMDASKETCNET